MFTPSFSKTKSTMRSPSASQQVNRFEIINDQRGIGKLSSVSKAFVLRAVNAFGGFSNRYIEFGKVTLGARTGTMNAFVLLMGAPLPGQNWIFVIVMLVSFVCAIRPSSFVIVP